MNTKVIVISMLILGIGCRGISKPPKKEIITYIALDVSEPLTKQDTLVDFAIAEIYNVIQKKPNKQNRIIIVRSGSKSTFPVELLNESFISKRSYKFNAEDTTPLEIQKFLKDIRKRLVQRLPVEPQDTSPIYQMVKSTIEEINEQYRGNSRIVYVKNIVVITDYFEDGVLSQTNLRDYIKREKEIADISKLKLNLTGINFRGCGIGAFGQSKSERIKDIWEKILNHKLSANCHTALPKGLSSLELGNVATSR